MKKLSGRTSTLTTDSRERFVKWARARWNRPTKRTLKAVVAVLVLLAVGRHVYLTWRRIEGNPGLVHVEPVWFVVSVVLYLAGLAAFGVYFHRILKAGPTPIGLAPAVRAYLISHLGKYVPGKALVVVMRVGLVTPYGARGVTAAFATLYETLVMMAGGAAVATVGFLISSLEFWPIITSLGLAAGLLVVVDPKIFPRFMALVSTPFKSIGADALPRFSRRLELEGLLIAAGGWMLLGLSLAAVILGLSRAGLEPAALPVVIASVGLATVAGFAVAVLPGGLGVREGVMMAALGPSVGAETAVLAALTLRLVWVLGEVLAAALLSFARPAVPDAPATRASTP
jgi:uncharacterized membrane protein YbhN (UPF0104 family)